LKWPIIWLEDFEKKFRKNFKPNDKQFQKRIFIFKQFLMIFSIKQ
jgi:hypothetical protein